MRHSVSRGRRERHREIWVADLSSIGRVPPSDTSGVAPTLHLWNPGTSHDLGIAVSLDGADGNVSC